jgi:hypothetical protein
MRFGQVSYSSQDAERANGVLNQVWKQRCAVRICYGRQGEMPHCKKYGAVFPPSPRSTEQDTPIQEDWRFSKFLTHTISRELVYMAQELIQDTVFRQDL